MIKNIYECNTLNSHKIHSILLPIRKLNKFFFSQLLLAVEICWLCYLSIYYKICNKVCMSKNPRSKFLNKYVILGVEELVIDSKPT